MSTGTIHRLSDDLHVIEGHHPHTLWEDPDLPTIGVYRSGSRLYLLDTGVGDEQYESIIDVVGRYPGLTEVVLLNSHGHVDHLGNNHVLDEIDAPSSRHFISREARPGLDYEAFFLQMYKSGLPYFDYLRGLDLDPGRIAGLLRKLGAPNTLDLSSVRELGAHIASSGLTSVVSAFMPSLIVDIILQTYPPVFPCVEKMIDYEELGAAQEIVIGSTRWSGWSFADELGNIDVQVLQSAGHSAGGVVFYVPRHDFMMLADETSPLPIWTDSNPENIVSTATKVIRMIDDGHVRQLCAGHRPMTPITGDDARVHLQQIIDSHAAFTLVVTDALLRHPDGVCIDDLYDLLVAEASPQSVIAAATRVQFPVFATFLKLTLLNHCRLHDLRAGTDDQGRITFRLAPA